MIAVVVGRNEAQELVSCVITGHAEYDDPGYDIVCAAVSALSATAILGLMQVAKQKGRYENESGRCEIECFGPIAPASQAILETMLLGLVEISRQYADFVTVSDSRK